MTNWKLTPPPYLGEGHKIRFNQNGSIWEGEIVGKELLTKITDAPVKKMVGKEIKIKFSQVVAWQPLKAKMVVHL